MWAEVRPRLGTVNAFVPSKNLNLVLISSDGSKILVQNNETDTTLTFPWPKQTLNAVIEPESVHALTLHKDGLSFRFRLKGRNLCVVNPYGGSRIRRKFINACHVSTANNGGMEQSIRCSKCRYLLTKLTTGRHLPLPAADWRGGVQDWFCACHHGLQQSDSSSSGTGVEKIANKRIHEKGLRPHDSDLLYAHCQIRLHSKYFREAIDESIGNGASSTTFATASQLSCPSCQAKLGDYCQKDDFVQLWHHTVILNDKEASALETFLLMLGGVCADHDWLPIKIRLKGSKDQIFIWMLEPDLQVVRLVNEGKEEQVLSLMKVMHNEDFELQVDQELSVPDDVIVAGLGHLQENSAMIPQGQRRDSNFHISYIRLDAVLLKEGSS